MTFQLVDAIAHPLPPLLPPLQVPRLPCQTDLLYAQKDRITHLEQRIKDLEDDLAHEISLREHYQQEAVDANDASEEFFLTTVQMAANISTTERQLELKFLSMQHSLAVWESWAAQHGIPVVQNKDTNHTPVFPAAAPEDTASSSN